MTSARDLAKLQEQGCIVHSNLGAAGLHPGDIDPATIEDPPDDESGYLDMYFVTGYTVPEPYATVPGSHSSLKVLAYAIFDDDAPMAQRREVAQATVDLCRMFFSQPL